MNDKELEKLRAEVIEFNMEHFAELHSDMETIDIVHLIACHFAEWQKGQTHTPNIELIQRSWYLEGYHDGKFEMEPMWTITACEGGPKVEKNPRYGEPLEEPEDHFREDTKKVDEDGASGETELDKECWRIWQTLNVRDEGMGCEYAEEIPIDQFYNICEHIANWQREQMMKEAVDGDVVLDLNLYKHVKSFGPIPDYLKFGDKVKIIIVKEQYL